MPLGSGHYSSKLSRITLPGILVNGLIISLLVAASACDNGDELPAVHYVAPELVMYFDQFKTEAIEYGYAPQLNINCRLICENIDGLYIGYADKARHIIAINPQYLNYPRMMEFIMMHECGHYFFDMKHGDNLIMADALDTKVVREYMQNRQFYLDQFFGVNNDQSNNYISSETVKNNTKNNVKCTLQE